MPMLRMDKLLSADGQLSRQDAKRLLAAGSVTVDGKTIQQASAKVDPDTQVICISGKRVTYAAHHYILLHKPLGVVSSTDDPDSPTVLSLLPQSLRAPGLFPAGRLDKYTTGMVILTDDGEFAHRILAPRKHLPKRYAFTLDAPILGERLVAEFAKGVYLGGGERSSPAVLLPKSPTEGEVVIFEGIYHQVRRMFDQNGGKVTALHRLQIGGLLLDPTLAPGESRPLREEEISAIFAPTPWDREEEKPCKP